MKHTFQSVNSPRSFGRRRRPSILPWIVLVATLGFLAWTVFGSDACAGGGCCCQINLAGDMCCTYDDFCTGCPCMF